MRMDSKGFFVIHTEPRKGKIILEHYGYDRKLAKKLSGSRAEALCKRAVSEGRVSDLSHAAYLGAQLARAEIALKQGLRFRQDSDLPKS